MLCLSHLLQIHSVAEHGFSAPTRGFSHCVKIDWLTCCDVIVNGLEIDLCAFGVEDVGEDIEQFSVL